MSIGTTGPPYDALAALQRIVQEFDPDLALYSVFSLDDAIDYGYANVRIAVLIIGWLGACGLLVAAAGLYALLAVRVTERTRELGIRRAVGAGAAAVGRTVIAQALTPLVVGVGAGFLLAWPVARSLVAIEPTVISLGPASFGWAAVAGLGGHCGPCGTPRAGARDRPARVAPPRVATHADGSGRPVSRSGDRPGPAPDGNTLAFQTVEGSSRR